MVKELLKKYKDMILYIVFGVLTTVVNILVFYISSHMLNLPTTVSTVIAWFLSVLFAYLTNRKWVFDSQVNNSKEFVKEIISFYVSRAATGAIDLLCMFVFVDVLHFNDVLIKTASNILVVILNYVASKWIIFKKSSD